MRPRWASGPLDMNASHTHMGTSGRRAGGAGGGARYSRDHALMRGRAETWAVWSEAFVLQKNGRKMAMDHELDEWRGYFNKTNSLRRFWRPNSIPPKREAES